MLCFAVLRNWLVPSLNSMCQECFVVQNTASNNHSVVKHGVAALPTTKASKPVEHDPAECVLDTGAKMRVHFIPLEQFVQVVAGLWMLLSMWSTLNPRLTKSSRLLERIAATFAACFPSYVSCTKRMWFAQSVLSVLDLFLVQGSPSPRRPTSASTARRYSLSEESFFALDTDRRTCTVRSDECVNALPPMCIDLPL